MCWKRCKCLDKILQQENWTIYKIILGITNSHFKCSNVKDLCPTDLKPNPVLSNSEIDRGAQTERNQLYYAEVDRHFETLGICRFLPAQATSERGDSCTNALKVIHGFALISGPCNLFVRGLAPLFTLDLSHVLRKWQESRTRAVGMKNMNYLPRVYATISLLSISWPHKIKAAAQASLCLCVLLSPLPATALLRLLWGLGALVFAALRLEQ